jgi:hypothetical protein
LIDPAAFAETVVPRYRPLVIRGLCAQWPLVRAGREGAAAMQDYLRRFDQGHPVPVMHGPPEIDGRFFYDPAMRGFNFERAQVPLMDLLAMLMQVADQPRPPALYAGATPMAGNLPGLDAENPLPIAVPGGEFRIWIGNATHIPTHYDMSDNIAVVAMGRRRFTLFPPEQVANLYVGPLEWNMAGQPVSMVDLRAPDFDRFPRFEQAWQHALQADLEPGDALYIPRLWWHDVVATGAMNVLVNNWHGVRGEASPFVAMVHAMLAVRDLPDAERQAWRAWFDHLVFGERDGAAVDHLPPHARGVLGPAVQGRAEAILDFVARSIQPR